MLAATRRSLDLGSPAQIVLVRQRDAEELAEGLRTLSEFALDYLI
jgi:hypothetical protein